MRSKENLARLEEQLAKAEERIRALETVIAEIRQGQGSGNAEPAPAKTTRRKTAGK